MELVRNVIAAGLLVAVLVGAGLEAAERPPGPRLEIRHPGRGHDVHVSAPALAVAPDGQAVLSWFAQEGSVNHLFVQSLPALGATPVRVNPDGLTVASLHQAPGLVVGRRGEVYVTWSSPRSDGVLSRKISGCPDRSTAGAPSTITCA
jgi:hypothetical protein